MPLCPWCGLSLVLFLRRLARARAVLRETAGVGGEEMGACRRQQGVTEAVATCLYPCVCVCASDSVRARARVCVCVGGQPESMRGCSAGRLCGPAPCKARVCRAGQLMHTPRVLDVHPGADQYNWQRGCGSCRG